LYNAHGQYEKYENRYGGAQNSGSIAQKVPYSQTNTASMGLQYATQGGGMRGSSQSSTTMKQSLNMAQQQAPGYGHAGSSVQFASMRGGSQNYHSYQKQPAAHLAKKSSKDNLHASKDQRGRPSDRYQPGSSTKSGYSHGQYQQQHHGSSKNVGQHRDSQYSQAQAQAQDHRQGGDRKGHNSKIQNALKKYMNDIGDGQAISPNANSGHYQTNSKYGHGGASQKLDGYSRGYNHTMGLEVGAGAGHAN